ncbi:hypothetical protein GQF61_17435 [Sphingobacterium sp. DK4209]|uniref:Aromatic hydrocarbon degradation protein n=1 Tax=Sphingobacterium zhuxiongii TaxID=2662364 RepID=A0A5Q0QCB5_9SPHI|nr:MULTISPECIES: hypothetical protein [unclassified Sphingobacterium]MVZ67632.1 hypothetical protein [Sphingobacterium sp. DK4209]QGA27213.1 hypothetical protein GFH32_13240 [Sphingobacterium sp. dk4302]
MKKSLLTLSLLALSAGMFNVFAQSTLNYVYDVSKDVTTGSARFKGMGGVNTALGGDISSISGNPAGLGFYGQSDISVSVNYLNNNNKTNYFGNSTNQNSGKFGLENVGIVLHVPSANGGYGWQNLNVGVSYDRTNNLNDRLVYSGVNDQNTLVQYLSDQMYEFADFASDFSRSNLVERFSDPSLGYFPTVLEKDPKSQQVDVLSSGYKAKTTLSFGGNYNNRFYLGGSLGLVSYKYDRNYSVYETGWTKTPDEIRPDSGPNSGFLNPTHQKNKYTDINYDLTDYEDNSLRGTGVNIAIGMIFKPTWDWNIGLHIVSPTWTTVKEERNLETVADYYQDENSSTKLHPTYNSNVSSTSYDYGVISPLKASVGLTKFFSRGLISADFEIVDYSSIQYQETSTEVTDFSFESDMNYDIKDYYKSAFNFRLGGEIIFTDRLSGRAGYRYFSSPFKGVNAADHMTSIGLGYIINQALYVDIAAIQFKKLTYDSSPYGLSNLWLSSPPTAEVKNSRTNVVLTLGAKF